MLIGWKTTALTLTLTIVLAASLSERAVNASPQTARAGKAHTAAASSVADSVAIPETTLAINSPTPMSERVVHYEIDAKYDAGTHTVNATEVLTYHNLTGQALDHFPFHLYQNAFQPKATFVREAKLMGSRDTGYEEWDPKDYGSEDIKSIEVVGQGDLTQNLQYIAPDDGNKDDKTVVDLRVAKPIPAGAYVQFKIAFVTKFPETQARSGWKRDFLLGGQWFPKVGVWWHGAWNCHQYHNTTEFFADFGVYDVKLTVPKYEVIGASGVEISSVDNADKTKTVTYHGDDIHDFAWTVSPRYKVRESTYQAQMGPIKLRFLMQPAHWSQAERHERITRESLDRFEKFYGPYPYKTLTVVDPEPDSAAGGMEYPTFITGETSWFAPQGVHLLEVVVEHEFGHQYWYGMVATNEFEDAWMDEGINSYTEVKVLDSILGKDTSMLDIWGATLGERQGQRLGYERSRSGCYGSEGVRLRQLEFLRRHYVRENRDGPADPRRHHRRRDDGQSHACLFHEVSLHPSHKRRFSEDDRGSLGQGSALVFQSGRLRLASVRLRDSQCQLICRELVRSGEREEERESREGQRQHSLRVLCDPASEGRLHDADLSGDQIRQRRNHPRALGWTRPMDSLWISEKGAGRIGGD